MILMEMSIVLPYAPLHMDNIWFLESSIEHINPNPFKQDKVSNNDHKSVQIVLCIMHVQWCRKSTQ